MREKTFRAVITFDTTAAAMAMEKLCLARGLPGRLIPVPRAITANCGVAWSAPSEEQERLLAAAAEAGVPTAGVYTMLL